MEVVKRRGRIKSFVECGMYRVGWKILCVGVMVGIIIGFFV